MGALRCGSVLGYLGWAKPKKKAEHEARPKSNREVNTTGSRAAIAFEFDLCLPCEPFKFFCRIPMQSRYATVA
jgi:hypothetical protein